MVFAIENNYLHDSFSIGLKNGRKIAVTIFPMYGLKALHHAAPKVRVCKIFNAMFYKDSTALYVLMKPLHKAKGTVQYKLSL